MTDNVLELTSVRKTYGDFVLRDVSFALPVGHVMGLVGPNGAGKTTIIKLIMNLVAPESGQIRVFGLDHRRHEAEVKARIGFVYDVPPFYGNVTLATTRRAVAPFYRNWNEALFRDLADRFELPLGKRVKALSQGMRTKFALALALAHDADLLLLDEPTTGLDPVFRRELLHGLSGLLEQEGKSILFSTHITTDLERIADYVTFIRDGSIRLVATRDELRERWGVVRGDVGAVSALDPSIRRGERRHAYGVDVLTSDAEAARQACGENVVVDRPSLEDVVVLLDREVRHA
jgi:ABC-2 type transport system ATP-binding protein